MSRQITVTDQVADALEAASSHDENGNQSFAATTTAAALGTGLLSLLPIILQVVTAVAGMLPAGALPKLLQALPQLITAAKAGDWGTVITLIVTVLNLPKPTPAQVSGSMGP